MPRTPTKPHLTRMHGVWRCSGPRKTYSAAGVGYAFPWAWGVTPEIAQRGWHRITNTPLPPELAPSTMDEHAENPGAA